MNATVYHIEHTWIKKGLFSDGGAPVCVNVIEVPDLACDKMADKDTVIMDLMKKIMNQVETIDSIILVDPGRQPSRRSFQSVSKTMRWLYFCVQNMFEHEIQQKFQIVLPESNLPGSTSASEKLKAAWCAHHIVDVNSHAFFERAYDEEVFTAYSSLR